MLPQDFIVRGSKATYERRIHGNLGIQARAFLRNTTPLEAISSRVGPIFRQMAAARAILDRDFDRVWTGEEESVDAKAHDC